ncbi:MAG TPA: DEAD/DEAH box helicase [Solirubrobacterales bacterium]
MPLAPRGRRISLDVQIRSTSITVSFADLGISQPVIGALARRDITTPFPVQQLVIRDSLDGHDLLVQSPTGSGKTLAFGIPLVERLEPGAGTGALVLAPTRELAGQIVDDLRPIAATRNLRIAAVYGGVGFGPQIKAASRADILVATPGRLEDLIARGAVSLEAIRILVLDEADRMLDMGFKPAVDRIVSRTPSKRQTLFFSATLEGATGKLAAAYTRDARTHTHAPKQAKADIEHRFLPVETQGEKLDHLVAQLQDGECGPTIVFVRTKRGADRLVKRLRGRQVEAVAMHGDKSQRQRERALARFEDGEVAALVATDVAARGIDVEGITHVVNYDTPEDPDSYVHRIGRTGRAGRSGTGVSFVLADQADDIRRMAGNLGLVREFEVAHGGRGQQLDSRPAPKRSQGRRRGKKQS